MRNFILLKNETVVEMMSRSTPMPEPWLEVSEANFDWIGRRFINGKIEAEETTSPMMTQVAWLKRLGDAVHLEIENRIATDPVLRIAQRMLLAANEVDVTDESTIKFANYLLQLALIDEAKRDELLAEIDLSQKGAIHPRTGIITP